MNARHVVASILVRCYPVEWRREYGTELIDLLMSRPLGAAVAVDVIVNALQQRARAASVSTSFGVATMLVVLGGVVLTPTSYGGAWAALVHPSGMTFPTMKVTFFSSEVFTVLLLWCGWRTELTSAGRWHRSGVAAARMTLIAGIPVMLAGVLMAVGGIDVTFVDSGNGPGLVPSPLAMIVAPLARAPESWIWGALGGWLARKMAPSGDATAAA